MQRTGRTPLFQAIRNTFRTARGGGPRPEIIPKRGWISRRQFLAGAAASVLAAYAGPARAAVRSPRVAVVGAGIAGLNATYLLAKAGFRVTLYEGSDNVGGRIK